MARMISNLNDLTKMINLQNKGVRQYFSYLTLQKQYCKLYFLEYTIPIIFLFIMKIQIYKQK